LVINTILKHVMSSAAEIGSAFLNANAATVLRTTLEEMGHHQPPATLQTDNKTATCYINGSIKQK
jgi:hypothetical protein